MGWSHPAYLSLSLSSTYHHPHMHLTTPHCSTLGSLFLFSSLSIWIRSYSISVVYCMACNDIGVEQNRLYVNTNVKTVDKSYSRQHETVTKGHQTTTKWINSFTRSFSSLMFISIILSQPSPSYLSSKH